MKEWPWYGYFLVGIILFGLFYFIYYKPKTNELNSLKTEREKLENEVRDLRLKKQRLDKIEARIETLNETLKELEVILPQKEEIHDILGRIQQLANDSRITITKFTPQKEIDKEFYDELPYLISTTGNYHNLAIFFDRLRRFPRLFYIDNFSIKTSSRQSESTTISANSTAKTFIFREETPAQTISKKKRGR